MQLPEIVLKALASKGISSLNPMQETAMETILAQPETLLLAPTGSGKTLAFLLPVWQMLNKEEKRVQCLVLTPSRELAIQIENVWKQLATGFKISCCYGGHDMPTEIQNLAEPPAILVGTPGRIADHIKRATFSREALQVFILDEFDKSLALGFEEDMSYIFSSLPGQFKKIFVSATSSVPIPSFAGVGDNLQVLDFLTGKKSEQELQLLTVFSEEKDKVNRLAELLSYINHEPALIFCNHRDAVERTAGLLKEKGIECAAFHGGMEQMQREQTLIQFRNGSVRFLIATDLAARGLDIPEMNHVIHYHLPSTEAEFIHRNGRTARMHATGTAYLLVSRGEELPYYLPQLPEEQKIPVGLALPKPSEWVTIYINGGKKDKLNKVDIVGFFTQKGGLQKEEIGLIIVKDRNAFAAVRKNKVKSLLALVMNEKIKGTKYKIVVAR
ncbi:MAG: DEAD/DEAH box helicase [Bacteroidota bacterium]|nr:DEAD/DEAH box helicase [Bacteroidota bacterium]